MADNPNRDQVYTLHAFNTSPDDQAVIQTTSTFVARGRANHMENIKLSGCRFCMYVCMLSAGTGPVCWTKPCGYIDTVHPGKDTFLFTKWLSRETYRHFERWLSVASLTRVGNLVILTNIHLENAHGLLPIWADENTLIRKDVDTFQCSVFRNHCCRVWTCDY